MSIAAKDIVGRTLRILQTDLDARIIPKLSDPDALFAARMTSELLTYLATWHLEPEGQHGSIQDLLSQVDSVSEDRLAALPEEWVGRWIDSSTGPGQAATFSDAELFASGKKKVEQYTASAAQYLSRTEVEMTGDRATALVDALRGPGHRVQSVVRVPGGFSKDSYFLDLRCPDGKLESYVVRRDLPFGPGETTVADEYTLLAELYRLKLPIAEPLGCDRTGIAGTPAMLSRRISGASGTQAFASDQDASRAICEQLAGILARLHRTKPADAGITLSSSDPRQVVRAYVLEWRDRWQRNRIHSSPTLAAAFDWLLANIPQEIDGPAIVHGDVGFHNIMVDDGTISALLDWEFAHVGDPTEDLGYCRTFIEGLISWDDFIAHYKACGGGKYRAANASFFELWSSVRNAATTAIAWRGFLDGSFPALKMAYQAVPLYRDFILRTAAMLRRLE